MLEMYNPCRNDDFIQVAIIFIQIFFLCRKKPSLLEYLGYIFNFSSVFTGPPPEYQDYMDFIDGTQYDKDKVVIMRGN